MRTKIDHEEVQCDGRNCKNVDQWPTNRRVTDHHWMRRDYHGLPTGLYCDDCFENNYPYRKDDYSDDMIANGECMNDDY
jgi:hypothetical protein